jgi:hypothetical protein
MLVGCDDASVWECGEGETARDGVCVPKTCESDGYNCPTCDTDIGEELLYFDDGSGFCKLTSCKTDGVINEDFKLVDINETTAMCVQKTCKADDYGCPECNEYQTLMYNPDGSGYCLQTSCPEGQKLENGVCIDGTCEYSLSGCIPGCICMLPLYGTQYPLESVNVPYCGVSFSENNYVEMYLNVGSGATTLADEAAVVYTVSDRGPTIKCSESLSVTGKQICPDGASDDSLIYLKADFVPAIYKFSIGSGADNIVLEDTILLKDANADPITGIANITMRDANIKNYTVYGEEIPFDPSGINPKAIVGFSDGSFWIGEDYSASLIHVNSEGKILNHLVPKGWESDFNTTSCPVRSVLPEILKMRYPNYGIEAVAKNANETHLYFMTERPLANPDLVASENSKNIRLFKMELSNPMNYSEYLYKLDSVDSRVSEMLNIDNDTLLVVETAGNSSKIYKIVLDDDHIIARKYDDISTSPSLENSDANVTALVKGVVQSFSRTVNGLADVGNDTYFIINENNFGLNGENTEVELINIKEPK